MLLDDAIDLRLLLGVIRADRRCERDAHVWREPHECHEPLLCEHRVGSVAAEGLLAAHAFDLEEDGLCCGDLACLGEFGRGLGEGGNGFEQRPCALGAEMGSAPFVPGVAELDAGVPLCFGDSGEGGPGVGVGSLALGAKAAGDGDRERERSTHDPGVVAVIGEAQRVEVEGGVVPEPGVFRVGCVYAGLEAGKAEVWVVKQGDALGLVQIDPVACVEG